MEQEKGKFMYEDKIHIKRYLGLSEDRLLVFARKINLSVRAAVKFRSPEEVAVFDNSVLEMSTNGDHWGNCIVHMDLFFKSLDGATKEKVDEIEEGCTQITNHILSEAEEGISFTFSDDDRVYVGDIIFCDMMYRYFRVLSSRKQNITTLIVLGVGGFPGEFMRNYITETREAITERFSSVH
ncbi:hypothetical protein CL630_02330 [bacterium]|nr:hypothetical protein [bacterium]